MANSSRENVNEHRRVQRDTLVQRQLTRSSMPSCQDKKTGYVYLIARTIKTLFSRCSLGMRRGGVEVREAPANAKVRG